MTEQLTIIRVNPDATMEIAGIFQVPDSPLDVVWLGDRRLAVIQSDLSLPNDVGIYDLDDSGPTLTLTERDREVTGGFCTYLFAHPTLDVLYTQDSNEPRKVEPWSIASNGTLTNLGASFTSPAYSLSICISERSLGILHRRNIERWPQHQRVQCGFVRRPDSRGEHTNTISRQLASRHCDLT